MFRRSFAGLLNLLTGSLNLQRLRGHRRKLVAGWLLCRWLSPSLLQAEDPFVATHFRQLRERGLYGVAEDFAGQRLTQGLFRADQRAQWSIELSRTLSEHARFVGSDPGGEELFDRALLVVDEALKTLTPSEIAPRWKLRVQRLEVLALRAEPAVWRAEVQPVEPLIEQARRLLGAAIDSANDLRADLAALQQAGRKVTAPDQPLDYRGLAVFLRLQLAELIQQQAALGVSAGSETDAQRDQSLLLVEEHFRGVISGAPDTGLERRARLGLARSARLRQDWAQYDELQRSLTGAAAGETQALELARFTEQARGWLDRERPEEVVTLTSELRQDKTPLPAELWYWRAVALLELQRLALERGDAALAGELEQAAQTDLDLARQTAGGVWIRRAFLVREKAGRSLRLGSTLDRQLQQAEALYVSGNPSAAAEQYLQLVVKLPQSLTPADKLSIAQTAASVLYQQQRYRELVDVMTPLLKETGPAGQIAAETDLLVCYALGQLLSTTQGSDAIEQYRQHLELHRQDYAGEQTVSEASYLLGRLAESQRDPAVALAAYREVATSSTRAEAAQLGELRCWERLVELPATVPLPPPDQEPAVLARQRCLEWADNTSQSVAVSIETQIAARRLLGKLALLQIPPDDHAAETHIQRATELVEQWPQEFPARTTWSQRLRPLQVVTLASRGETDAARQLLGDLPDQPGQVLFETVRELSMLSERQPRRAVLVAPLIDAGTARLAALKPPLSASQQSEVLSWRVAALIARGEPTVAATALSQQLQLAGQDSAQISRVAQVALDLHNPAAAKVARRGYLLLERLHPAGSDPWFAARLGLIRASSQTGPHEELLKLVAATRALYADHIDDTVDAELIRLCAGP